MSNYLQWHKTKSNDKENSEVEECESFSRCESFFYNKLNSMHIKHVNKLLIDMLTDWGKFPIGPIWNNELHTPFNLDHNSSDRGTMLFVRENIPEKLILPE